MPSLPSFAGLYDLVSRWLVLPVVGRRLRRALAGASGIVLEVGSGTGATLDSYGQGVQRLVLTDPDASMLTVARERARQRGPHVLVCRCRAEALPFHAGAFDAAVTSLVLCTVSDQDGALTELRRVLRAAGTLHLLEHVRGAGLTGRVLDACTPAWRRFAGGCELNRRTDEALQDNGFTLDAVERRSLLGLPLISGTARRA